MRVGPGLKGVQCFKHIGLARPAVGIVPTSVDFEDDVAGGVGGSTTVGGDEFRFGQTGIPTMQHQVEPTWASGIGQLGHKNGVGLD